VEVVTVGEVDELAIQRRQQLGDAFGFADYELRAIRDEGGFANDAISALRFTSEHLGMQDVQAVSCDICGALFTERLRMMRRHRLECGWK
jgi:hypothetical protein